MNQLIGYQEGEGLFYRLSGTSKLFLFLIVSLVCMVTYDTRLLFVLSVFSLLLFKQANIKLSDYSLVLKIVATVALLNIILVYLFAPDYGKQIYGSEDIIFQGWGRFYLSSQEVFYLLNLTLKYFCTLPPAILFLVTTHPSQFAASLNQLGVSYKVAYSVSLTLRYIPDIQEEFFMIRTSQEARGLDLSKKSPLMQRIRGNLQIVIPLIFSSLERIDTIATAMELRRFGRHKKRTWYRTQELRKADWFIIAFGLLLILITIALFYLNQGRFYNPWNV